MAQLYACNGCDTCNKCVACQQCVSCEVECNQAQTLPEKSGCGVLGQFLKKDFAFDPPPTKDMTLMGPENGKFNKATWDSIIEYHNSGKGIGKLVALVQKDIAYSTTDAVAPFSAAEFNRVSNALKAGITVNSGDVILGSYFTRLEKAVSEYKVSDVACDKCNTACDCDGAITSSCVACLKCNSGVTDANGGYTYCCSCNTCQGCNGGCQSSQKPATGGTTTT